ncbi:ATP-dependent RNA helicase RhlE [Thalassococcus halodurans]|uniref:ATP-dependent RNA helicase RhlE n=1 Tax=Thalassococcus halodurans TaxID=373675 RepID=A0A1H6A8P2_9RHOB|nr:ATP-dependent RNA helicase RhlE [Thalassococcus halodurans]
MSQFQQLGLSPALTDELARAGFDQPTPIQQQAIPLALEGHDILGLAQTGTGKTMAFGLPMIDLIKGNSEKRAAKSAKALILAPTRELVNQIAENLLPMVRSLSLRITKVVGGQSINRQVTALAKGTDVLVATPGRLIDLLDRGDVTLSSTRFLVLDEADQMLDMGFIHDLKKIAPRLATPRQTMLFSATMPKQLEELSRSYLSNPKRVQVAPPGKTADKIKQSVLFLDKPQKQKKLREILSDDLGGLSLVFARTKRGAERLSKDLIADGYNAASIHGNKSQGQRDRAIKAFREGTVTVLVATDVAARGIDIPGVARVINYELPNVAESYVHRIGRTARAGREGEAISFCSPDERSLLKDIEKLIKREFEGKPAEGKSERPAPAKSDRGDGKSKPPRRSRRRRSKGPKNDAPKSANNGSRGNPRSGQNRVNKGSGPKKKSSAA